MIRIEIYVGAYALVGRVVEFLELFEPIGVERHLLMTRKVTTVVGLDIVAHWAVDPLS